MNVIDQFLIFCSIKCDILVFRGKNRLSSDIFLLFEGHLKEIIMGFYVQVHLLLSSLGISGRALQ
jgi:hypothetical protein